MADEWKNEDGQHGENAQKQNTLPSGQQGQQSQADRQESGQHGLSDQDMMTQEDEASETSSDDTSFGQSGADGSAFIGAQSAGSDEDLPDQDPQSDFAERDALTQENDDGMGEAGR